MFNMERVSHQAVPGALRAPPWACRWLLGSAPPQPTLCACLSSMSLAKDTGYPGLQPDQRSPSALWWSVLQTVTMLRNLKSGLCCKCLFPYLFVWKAKRNISLPPVLISLFRCLQHPGLGQAKFRTPELNLGFPRGWQRSNCVSHHWLLLNTSISTNPGLEESGGSSLGIPMPSLPWPNACPGDSIFNIGHNLTKNTPKCLKQVCIVRIKRKTRREGWVCGIYCSALKTIPMK